MLLKIRNCGHIVSFKNSKMIARGRLMTSPIKQKAMDSYTRAIESELCSAFRTTAGETQMGHSLAYWIRSYVPQDDSVQWVPQISIEVLRVGKGEEGADITIERLPPNVINTAKD